MASQKRKGDDMHNISVKRSKGSKPKVDCSTKSGTQFFEGFVFYILPAGIQKARLQLFRSHLQNHGGCLKDSVTNEVTHIIVDDEMSSERMCRIMKVDTPPTDRVILKTAWLSACLRQKAVATAEDFLLPISVSCKRKGSDNDDTTSSTAWNKNQTRTKEIEKEDTPPRPEQQFPKVGVMWNAFKSKSKGEESEETDSDYVPSDDEASDDRVVSTNGPSTSSADTTPSTSPEKRSVPVGKWICAQSSKAPKRNLNEHITAKLEEMVKTYESTNDKWRAFGYQKAIAALRRYPKQITSWEEARSLQGVGSKLADKIWEIAQSGELRKLNEFQSSEQVRVLKLFTDVWGAGPTTANAWYQQGFRTLDDLKTKANLTHQQKVGVRLYDDLLDRMPREEAAEIERVVREAAEWIQPGIIAQACGSYRRGKKDCGDVDVLLTHPDGRSEKGLFGKLIQHLKDTGFLTDDLVSVEDDGNQKKYLGVCKLPGEDRKHRRLDIIVVPYEEYACALVYFTGSAHFNRSLRHLCKKMGMSLNEHALRKGVVRKGQEKIYEGTIVPTPTEESVLAALGVPFRPPEERDH
ncbi:DNA polymerase lambda-like [Babylonia areolata]|uniref:DNA polymerase lambda-like n=1 Tax=Babylonia areolata TaxID=304850 RepID=UPI003FD45BF3